MITGGLRFTIVALVIVGGFLLLGGSRESMARPLAEPTQTWPKEWDPRLDGLNVTYHPAADCSQGCWRLESARFEDVDESNGLHHIWVRLLNADGQQVADLPWHVAWPDGDTRTMSKASPDWADFAMYAGYDPAQGAGPYRAYAGDDETRSDVVRGMGLPLNQHVSFRLVWRWVEGGTAPQTYTVYMPVVVRQPPPAPTPTPTSTPTSETPTPTPTPTSGTPTPTPVPTTPYTGTFVRWEPNCGGTQVKGTVRDANGNPLAGVTVRVLLFGIQHGDPLTTSEQGFYEFNRFGTSDPLLEIDYTVAIIDPATGQLLSNEVYVRTDRNDCEPGGSGHQVATIDFQRNW